MSTVYAIANQKGGVGKTTTAVNLSACVAEAGYEALLIDIDPQSNATLALGIDKHTKPTVYDALIGELPLEETIVASGIAHLGVIPAGPTWRARRSSCRGSRARRTVCARRSRRP